MTKSYIPTAGEVTESVRSRVVSWTDPEIGLSAAKSMSGLDYLRQVVDGRMAPPPITSTIGFAFAAVEEGRVEFVLEPAEYHYNPLGSVHGSVYAALLDSACGCAVHTMLPPGVGYTSIDLTVKFLRGMNSATGQVQCVGTVRNIGRRTALAEASITDHQGRLYATAVSSCMLLP
jgi:uncharacterized protein (TIGR00369 family)